MTTRDPKSHSPARAARTIGAVAARKRDQLKQFEAARKRSIDKLNQERAALAQAVAEAEARERRRVRNQQMADQKRLKFILGGLMLGSLRSLGELGFSMTAEDLKQLPEKDRTLLTQVLAAHVSASTVDTPPEKPNGPEDDEGVDVPL